MRVHLTSLLDSLSGLWAMTAASMNQMGVDGILRILERFGVPVILVFVFLGIYTGYIPSQLAYDHRKIAVNVKYNQGLVLGVFQSGHAHCLNEAERFPEIEDPARRNVVIEKRVHRCNEAKDNMLEFLETIKEAAL